MKNKNLSMEECAELQIAIRNFINKLSKDYAIEHIFLYLSKEFSHTFYASSEEINDEFIMIMKEVLENIMKVKKRKIVDWREKNGR